MVEARAPTSHLAPLDSAGARRAGCDHGVDRFDEMVDLEPLDPAPERCAGCLP
jgi:hypothetical protein